MALTRLAGRRRTAVLCVACAAFALHAANLIYRARADRCFDLVLRCESARGPWGAATGDYGSYETVARQIQSEGFLGASYWDRPPGYPAMLVVSHWLTGSFAPVHWFAPPLAAAAPAAVAWAAAAFAGRARAGWLAGLLFGLWWSAYQYAADMRTDGPHAFLAVTAFALTLRWRDGGRPRAALGAAALWMAAQSLRPTFFALPLILPALLWRRRHPARAARVSLALWASTLVVPCFVMGANRVQHGAAVASQRGPHNLACYAVPRLLQELGEGTFAELRAACEARFQKVPPHARSGRQIDFALSAFGAHPAETLRSFAREFAFQMAYGQRLARYPKYYPGWPVWGPGLMQLFWLCAALGWLTIARRDPGTAIFLAFALALVMGPASSSHMVADRLRLPVDLLFLPLVAALLDRSFAALARRALALRPDAVAKS